MIKDLEERFEAAMKKGEREDKQESVRKAHDEEEKSARERKNISEEKQLRERADSYFKKRYPEGKPSREVIEKDNKEAHEKYTKARDEEDAKKIKAGTHRYHQPSYQGSSKEEEQVGIKHN